MAGNSISPSDLVNSSTADEIRERLKSEYENVYKTAIGYRLVNGQKTDEPCIFAYVDEKESETTLHSNEVIPRQSNGIAIDVREVNRDDTELADSHSPTRRNRVRPVAGGLQVSESVNDTYGTIGPMINDPDGNKAFLIAYHQAQDPDVPALYQPLEDSSQPEDNQIGLPTQGSFDNDWFEVELDNSSNFTNEIIGVGAPTEIAEPSLDDRILCSGARTGLVGLELIAIDVGSDRQDYELFADEDAPTGGNSGAALSFYDSTDDEMKLFGMINSTTNNIIHAGSLSQIQSNLGFTLDTGSYSLSGDGSDPYFEATVLDYNPITNQADIRVVNAGGSTGTDTVLVRNPGGSVESSQEVTLSAFDHDTLTMDWGYNDWGSVETSDNSWDIDLGAYTHTTVVESFEEGSLPTKFSGERGAFAVQSGNDWAGRRGNYYLQSSTNNEDCITTTDDTIGPSDTPIEIDFHYEFECALAFGVQTSGGNAEYTGYTIVIDSVGQTLLQRVDSGTEVDLDYGLASNMLPGLITVRIREWTTDGDIVCELLDRNGVVQSVVGVSGETTYGAGGWGVEMQSQNGNAQFCDHLRINDGSAPASPSSLTQVN